MTRRSVGCGRGYRCFLAIRTVFDQNAMKATVRPDNCHGTRRRDKPRQRTQRTAVTQHHALPQRIEWDLLGWTDVHLCPCFRHNPPPISSASALTVSRDTVQIMPSDMPGQHCGVGGRSRLKLESQ
jgi:hypothetical protein